eukprot:g5849.t1
MSESVESKLEKFLSEKSTFRNAIKAVFSEADLDKTGTLTLQEIATVTDKIFDEIENDLTAYDMQFSRPRVDEIQKLLTFVDKNKNSVLDEEEFFQFYRQVIKYYATVSGGSDSVMQDQGPILRFLPKILIATAGLFGVQIVALRVPNVSDTIAPFIEKVPVFIVGPIMGALCALFTEGGQFESFKKELFKDTKKTA